MILIHLTLIMKVQLPCHFHKASIAWILLDMLKGNILTSKVYALFEFLLHIYSEK